MDAKFKAKKEANAKQDALKAKRHAPTKTDAVKVSKAKEPSSQTPKSAQNNMANRTRSGTSTPGPQIVLARQHAPPDHTERATATTTQPLPQQSPPIHTAHATATATPDKVETLKKTKVCQSQRIASLPLFFKMAQNQDLRCILLPAR